jgi:2,3-dihydro-2,3-dihydroxybenzoate dehydrogenase
VTDPTFAGSVALVTGGASGIGRAVVEALLACGARVAAADLDVRGLEPLVREHGGALSRQRVDVSDRDAVEACVEGVERELGPVDFLVHAAGVLMASDLSAPALSLAAFRQTFAVNVEGVLLVTQAVAQRMAQRGRGAVVLVSSNAADTPRMGMGAYCASKAAATMLIKCFGLELAGSGVRCNVVSPGSTATPMLERMLGGRGPAQLVAGDLSRFRMGIPLGRIANADDIASAVLFLLSPAARHITMHDLRVDGGATC